MIKMEAIPMFDDKSVIKSDIKFDTSTKLTTWIGHKVLGQLLVMTALLTAENIWFFCNLYLQFIAPINFWNKRIDWRLFSKYVCVLFLRPLRTKDDFEAATSKLGNHF